MTCPQRKMRPLSGVGSQERVVPLAKCAIYRKAPKLHLAVALVWRCKKDSQKHATLKVGPCAWPLVRGLGGSSSERCEGFFCRKGLHYKASLLHLRFIYLQIVGMPEVHLQLAGLCYHI